MIDILYLAKGRPEFTRASTLALYYNTPAALYDWVAVPPADSPVGVMQNYLSHTGRDIFAKIDNDTIVPPGWLEQCLAVMEAHPELDLLGIEPPRSRTPNPANGRKAPIPEDDVTKLRRDLQARAEEYQGYACEIQKQVGYAACDSVGGIGLFRRRAFYRFPDLKAHSTYGGFTDWQLRHPEITKGWIVPPLKLFLLDRLPVEPWASLSKRYIAEGAQRAWTAYRPEDHELWDWWLKEKP